jgi:hypothetical protein
MRWRPASDIPVTHDLRTETIKHEPHDATQQVRTGSFWRETHHNALTASHNPASVEFRPFSRTFAHPSSLGPLILGLWAGTYHQVPEAIAVIEYDVELALFVGLDAGKLPHRPSPQTATIGWNHEFRVNVLATLA